MAVEEQGSRRILLLDDDEVMRAVVPALLSLHGYEAIVASTGEEAVALLGDEAAPGTILTDLQMSGMEGEALIDALRRTAPAGALLLGMSGRQPSGAILAKLDAFLSKPFTANQLAEALNFAEAQRGGQQVFPSSNSREQVCSPEDEDREPPLDEKIFAAMAKSFRADQLLELYTLTLDDVAARHERMAAAWGQGDLDTVHREAHAVKGSCGMVGARELQSLASAVEGGTTLNTSALQQFPPACDRLRRMLDSKLPQKW